MRTKSGRGDVLLVCMVLFLVVFGLAVLYSTGSYNGSVRFGDAFYYMKKQFFAAALGMLAMYLISCMDYHIFEKYAIAAYLISLALSTLVLFAGNAYNGSRRWLSLGPLSFQPSEFAKLAVILFLARMVGRQKKKRNSFLNLVFVIALVLPIVALVGTNNLSTAIIILGIAVIVVFVSDKRYMQFVWIAAAGAGMMALFLGMESYRLERIAIWKNPEAYEKGYQTIQGLYAIGSGGLLGKGLGQSIQKLSFLPEPQNDMIFAVICEELGLFGAIAVIFMFLFMLYRFLVIAGNAPDLFGAMLVTGVLAHIAIQVVLNIAVVTNVIPNTGITLPFISYGGTSILFLMAEMGIALSISRQIRVEE